MTPRRLYYGWVVVAGAFLITLAGYAIRNTFTVFYPVIVDDFGWSRGDTAIMYSLTMVCYGMVAPVAGGLVDRFNPKLVFSIGGITIGGGIALCSMATQLWHFYLCYGVMVAVGLSLIGFTPLSSVITHWFASRKAMAFGLIGAGYGVSLVAAPVFQYLIDAYAWRTGYLIVGAAATLIVVPIAVFVLKRSPEQKVLMGQGAADSAGASSPEATAVASPQWTVRKALRTRTYWLILIISFCNMGFAHGIFIAHEVYFLRDMGYSPMTAASMFSVFGIAFIIGNLSTGLSDRFGRVKIFVPGCLLAAAAVFFLFMAEGSQSMVLAGVFAVCSGFGLGITPPTCYAAAADCFGGRNYGSIQGVIILSVALGSGVGPWLGGYLHDITGTYTSTFILVQVALVVAGILMWIARPSRTTLKLNID